jgi:hypothetical protein
LAIVTVQVHNDLAHIHIGHQYVWLCVRVRKATMLAHDSL